jgi:hypothetical protein
MFAAVTNQVLILESQLAANWRGYFSLAPGRYLSIQENRTRSKSKKNSGQKAKSWKT